MKLRTEVSLDIDANRKLWLTSVADGVDVDEVEEVVSNMAGALVDQVVKAHAIVAPGLEGKPPEPTMPQTFGED